MTHQVNAQSNTTLHAAGRSDVGLKRKINQDAYRIQHPTERSPFGLYMVADGVSSKPRGELASATAVESFYNKFYGLPDSVSLQERVRQALETANDAVREQAELEGLDVIATTIAGIAVEPSGIGIVFNVGDSRVYRIAQGQIDEISEDQISRRQSEFVRDEVDRKRSTKLSTWLGQTEPLVANLSRVRMQSNDIYVICTDGLWSEVDKLELREIIGKLGLDLAATRLIELVKERGAPDNLTVVIIQAGAIKPARAAFPRQYWPAAIAAAVIIVALLIGVILLATRTAAPTLAVIAGSPTAIERVSTAQATPEASETEESALAVITETSIAPVSVTASGSPTEEVTEISAATQTATASATASKTATATPTASASASPTAMATETATPTETASATSSPTATKTSTPTAMASATASPTETASPTPTARATSTPRAVALAATAEGTADAAATETLAVITTVPHAGDLTAETGNEEPLVTAIIPDATDATTDTVTPPSLPTKGPLVMPTVLTKVAPPTVGFTETATLTATPALTLTATVRPTSTSTETTVPTATVTDTASPTATQTLTPKPAITPTPSITPVPTSTEPPPPGEAVIPPDPWQWFLFHTRNFAPSATSEATESAATPEATAVLAGTTGTPGLPSIMVPANSEGVLVHSKPLLNSSVIKGIGASEQAPIIAYCDTQVSSPAIYWYKIRFSRGVTGWVRGDVVDLVGSLSLAAHDPPCPGK